MFKILIFLFILPLGFFANRRLNLSGFRNALKNFIIFAGSPALFLHSILSQQKIEFGSIAAVIAFSLVMNMIISKAGSRIFNLKDRGCFLLLNSFGNAGFLGLPLVWVVFGDQGLYYGSLYVVVGSLVHFGLGIPAALLEERTNWFSAVKDSLKFPSFWMSLAIFLISGLSITLPNNIMSTLGFIGKITLYLIMFYVGINLVKPEGIRDFYRQFLYVGVFRFIISPLVILIPLLFLKSEGSWVLAFEAMMPPAIFNTVVASYYRMNEKLCANITATLTILFLLGFILIGLIFSIV